LEADRRHHARIALRGELSSDSSEAAQLLARYSLRVGPRVASAPVGLLTVRKASRACDTTIHTTVLVAVRQTICMAEDGAQRHSKRRACARWSAERLNRTRHRQRMPRVLLNAICRQRPACCCRTARQKRASAALARRLLWRHRRARAAATVLRGVDGSGTAPARSSCTTRTSCATEDVATPVDGGEARAFSPAALDLPGNARCARRPTADHARDRGVRSGLGG
jgi:hypothetical protein